MWEHREENHPGQTPKFSPKSKDMLLALVAEQNVDVIEELENLRNDKVAFQEVALAMDGATQDAAAANTAAIAELSRKMENLNKNVPKETVDGQKATSEVPKTNSDKEEDVKAKEKDSERSQEPPKRVKNRQSKRKQSESVAWIGTSISKALDKHKFENDNKVKLKF